MWTMPAKLQRHRFFFLALLDHVTFLQNSTQNSLQIHFWSRNVEKTHVKQQNQGKRAIFLLGKYENYSCQLFSRPKSEAKLCLEYP